MNKPRALKDTVYIDVDDEITSIIDKVEASKHKIVALVLPKRAAPLQSIVNMRLLARSAENAGKNVVLITSQAALLPLAGAAGLHVAKNLQSKPEIPPAPGVDSPAAADDGAAEELADDAGLDLSKPIGMLAADHALDEGTIDLEDETETKVKPSAPAKKSKKLKVPNFEKFRLLLGLGAAAIIGLIAFAILAIFVWPKAEITVVTTSTPVSASFELKTSDTADELDIEQGVIPASIKITEQTSTQQVPATGQQNRGEKATGKVTLSLTDCSKDQVSVPAGTAVTASGLTFITRKSATLQSVKIGNQCRNNDFPSFSKSTVDVQAQNAGANYNIGPSNFSVSGFSNVSGASGDAMSGGTDNIVTVVSSQDVETAKQKITSADSDEFSRTFQRQLEETGFYVLASTLKLSEPETTTTPEVGQQASSVNVTIKINYSVLVVPREDLERAMETKLKQQIDEERQKISLEDVLEGVNISVQDQNQNAPARATLIIEQETTAVPIMNVQEIKQQVVGMKRSQIEGHIKQIPGVENVSVKFSPFWVSKAPSKLDKVIIKLEQVEESDSSSN